MNSFHHLIPKDLQEVLEIWTEPTSRPKSIEAQHWLSFRLRRVLVTPDRPFFVGASANTLASRILSCDDSLVFRLTRRSKDVAESKARDEFWSSFAGASHVIGELRGTYDVPLGEHASLFFLLVEIATRVRDGYVTHSGKRLSHSEVQARVSRLSALATEMGELLNELQHDFDVIELANAPLERPDTVGDPIAEEFSSTERESWGLLPYLNLPSVSIGDVVAYLANLDAGPRHRVQPLRPNQPGAIADLLIFEMGQHLYSVAFDHACEIIFHFLEVLSGDLNCELPTRVQVRGRMRELWDSRRD